jgi:hypothetical protein
VAELAFDTQIDVRYGGGDRFLAGFRTAKAVYDADNDFEFPEVMENSSDDG